MPIDTETGYELEAGCECRPCKKCNGEGEWFCSILKFNLMCLACLGTGRDSSRCEIEHESTAKEGK